MASDVVAVDDQGYARTPWRRFTEISANSGLSPSREETPFSLESFDEPTHPEMSFDLWDPGADPQATPESAQLSVYQGNGESADGGTLRFIMRLTIRPDESRGRFWIRFDIDAAMIYAS
jgi:hypothetical protein